MSPSVESLPAAASPPAEPPLPSWIREEMAMAEAELEAHEAKLIYEDNEPVDGIYSEWQMRLLADTLRTSWKTDRKFVVSANVGVFYALKSPPIVPDVFVSMDVEYPQVRNAVRGKTYLVWRMAKAPDIAIEVVSNRDGGELTRKKQLYGEILKVNYYVVWDPEAYLSEKPLTVFAMRGGSYQIITEANFPEVGLRLVVWEGEYGGLQDHWLRWVDSDGTLLPIGKEHADRADAERERADAEQERADAEKARREEAERQVANLKAKLRDLEGNSGSESK